MGKSRLEAFSDGVIAIIITIMVLDLKLPMGSDFAAVLPVLPVFLNYVLSFATVAIYWNNHHHLLHAAQRISGAVLWANTHLLFWLSLFPFVTGWMGENYSAHLPAAIYGGVAFMASISYWLLERVIMRGLVGTTEATKLVVSISLLVGMIGLANVIWKPGVSRPMATFFQGQTIDLGVTTITYHQAITIAVAILVAVGLRLLLFRTRMGVSMRANVDDRTLALLNGARPDRVAIYSWAVGSSLAALGGILIAPSIALDAASLSLVIVNAYAAYEARTGSGVAGPVRDGGLRGRPAERGDGRAGSRGPRKRAQ